MTVVLPMGLFVLAFGWWVSRTFSTRLLRTFMRVCVTCIVALCLTMVALSEGPVFEIPVSHAPTQASNF
jgi:hypothetical protein